MTANEKRERLSRYQHLAQSVDALHTQILAVQRTMSRLKDVQAASLQDERRMAEELLMDAQSMLLREMMQCEAQRCSIQQAIAGLADVRLRTLLEYKYLCGMHEQRIAWRMCYSVDRIRHLHRDALQCLQFTEEKGESPCKRPEQQPFPAKNGDVLPINSTMFRSGSAPS